MDDTIQNWIQQIDQVTKSFEASFKSLSADHLNWKPNPQAWSIAQNIDHLIKINQSYFPLFTELKAGRFKKPSLAKIGFLSTFFGKLILKSVQPENKKKTRTFPVWEPSMSQINRAIISDFKTHQEELKDEIKRLKPHIEEGAIITSPANKNIFYKLQTAIDIIVNHEQRHFEQAVSVMNQLNENSNNEYSL